MSTKISTVSEIKLVPVGLHIVFYSLVNLKLGSYVKIPISGELAAFKIIAIEAVSPSKLSVAAKIITRRMVHEVEGFDLRALLVAPVETVTDKKEIEQLRIAETYC
jgi:hypothetical protein